MFNFIDKKYISLLLAITASLGFYGLNPAGMDENAVRAISVGILMIILWVTEALPMPVVALVPLVLHPLLGIGKSEETAAAYANPVIFLFFGGFMLGLAIEKWNLHKRIALNIIHATGTSGDRIILGFILATGLLSMWLSNTATTMMMYPIAMSVISVMQHHHKEGNITHFAMAIMLSIAYASNFGGIATIIGTPPNVAFAGYYFEKYGVELDFFRWMVLCLPISLLLLASLYFVISKWLFPNFIRSSQDTYAYVVAEKQGLGPMSVSERRVLMVFICTALLWIFRSLINEAQDFFRLDDTIIAIMAAITLFITPSEKQGHALLDWQDTSRMAWGILLLFGGGIALANSLEKAGLIQQLGSWLAGFGQNTMMLVFLVIVLSLFIGELMSNIAQVIVFAPLVSSMADVLHLNPLLLGIPMTLAASCAGMMPMATPPNAIVFASGHIKFRDMVKTGFVMNLISILLILVFSWLVLPLLWT
ncbi:MAG: DASS family sodium-coupled anion symporter [Saprospiraceae bacterium]|nr:DASS family sodium-coupled anion symporter [Saprospiraceae bacterium]